jgi:uncharacterized protein (DUF3084 family)
MQIDSDISFDSIDSIEQTNTIELIQSIKSTIDKLQTALDQLKTAVASLENNTATVTNEEKDKKKPAVATETKKRLSKTERLALQRAQQWYQTKTTQSSSPPVASIPKSRKKKNARDNSSRRT